MNEQKFVNGLFVNRRENAPDFVKANLAFNEKFIAYLQENFNAKGYVNVDVLESKEGKLYAKLNDWKPQEQTGEQKPISLFSLYGDEQKDLEADKGFDVSSVPF